MQAEPDHRFRNRAGKLASLVIGEIVCVHFEDSVLKEGRLDPDSLDLVGRMGGTQYSRTTGRFELKRPEVQEPTALPAYRMESRSSIRALSAAVSRIRPKRG